MLRRLLLFYPQFTFQKILTNSRCLCELLITNEDLTPNFLIFRVFRAIAVGLRERGDSSPQK